MKSMSVPWIPRTVILNWQGNYSDAGSWLELISATMVACETHRRFDLTSDDFVFLVNSLGLRVCVQAVMLVCNGIKSHL